ncbi:DUF2085 domain-containing protein [Candidatus Micrarchaeota archaeon]|nr:DUF2085 domain-containing protein [Candidatus Micrarchaeota archaeon]
MDRATAVYLAYVGFFVILMGIIFAIPYLAFNNDVNSAYNAFSYACHQKISRSQCIFQYSQIERGTLLGYSLEDCTSQEGKFIESQSDRTQIKIVMSDGIGTKIGYKLPVCARDIGIYGGMLIGAIVYLGVRKIKNEKLWPPIFLVLSMVPMGIDGTTQLISELGLLPFVYESTNMIRLATGLIAGIIASFYAIPILVGAVSESRENKKMATNASEKTKKQ